MHKFKMKAHLVVFISHLIFFSAFDPSTRPGLCMEAFSTDTGLSQPHAGITVTDSCRTVYLSSAHGGFKGLKGWWPPGAHTGSLLYSEKPSAENKGRQCNAAK